MRGYHPAAMKALAVWVAALVLAPAAAASTPLGDLAVHDLQLQVNANGKALLTYRREDGRIRNVLVWGAINARPPSTTAPQVAFHFDYSGGLVEPRPLRSAAFREPLRAVRRADASPFLVTACKAPDGTYWAVQAWRRLLPMRGFAPWLPDQDKLEFHVSHWSGPLAAARGVAELDVRRPLAGAVRQAHVPRAAGVRVPHAVRDEAR